MAQLGPCPKQTFECCLNLNINSILQCWKLYFQPFHILSVVLTAASKQRTTRDCCPWLAPGRKGSYVSSPGSCSPSVKIFCQQTDKASSRVQCLSVGPLGPQYVSPSPGEGDCTTQVVQCPSPGLGIYTVNIQQQNKCFG